jgi:hypothetical protein
MCELAEVSNTAAGESHYLSWPNIIARSLGAEFHTIAWSGYGLPNNCCGGETTMPTIYGRTLASVPDGTSPWDFKQWLPHAVVINLGTNDVFSGSWDEAVFTDAYLSLTANITLAYGPTVALFLACGPMTDVYCAAVAQVIDALAIQPNGPPAYFFDQTNLGLGLSCCGHPSADDDAIMGQAGAALIKEMMAWD